MRFAGPKAVKVTPVNVTARATSPTVSCDSDFESDFECRSANRRAAHGVSHNKNWGDSRGAVTSRAETAPIMTKAKRRAWLELSFAPRAETAPSPTMTATAKIRPNKTSSSLMAPIRKAFSSSRASSVPNSEMSAPGRLSTCQPVAPRSESTWSNGSRPAPVAANQPSPTRPPSTAVRAAAARRLRATAPTTSNAGQILIAAPTTVRAANSTEPVLAEPACWSVRPSKAAAAPIAKTVTAISNRSRPIGTKGRPRMRNALAARAPKNRLRATTPISSARAEKTTIARFVATTSAPASKSNTATEPGGYSTGSPAQAGEVRSAISWNRSASQPESSDG